MSILIRSWDNQIFYFLSNSNAIFINRREIGKYFLKRSKFFKQSNELTMQESNSRWQQRFSNYKKALAKLDQAVTKIKEVYKIDEEGRVDKDDFLDDILKEGLIQRFEYTHELAWNVMKDFLKNSGNTEIYGSKDATREAFSAALISNGEVWMDMIKSRNKTSHTYNEETADDIFMKVIYEYFEEFVDFRDKMEALDSGQQGKIW